jgi:hypothetical protein
MKKEVKRDDYFKGNTSCLHTMGAVTPIRGFLVEKNTTNVVINEPIQLSFFVQVE